MSTLVGLDAFMARALERREKSVGRKPRFRRSVSAAFDLAARCNANLVVRHFSAPAYVHSEDVIIVPPQIYRLVHRPKCKRRRQNPSVKRPSRSVAPE